ncbi:MAG: hypothetical protein R3E85_07200 [Planctomycetota bacterium]
MLARRDAHRLRPADPLGVLRRLDAAAGIGYRFLVEAGGERGRSWARQPECLARRRDHPHLDGGAGEDAGPVEGGDLGRRSTSSTRTRTAASTPSWTTSWDGCARWRHASRRPPPAVEAAGRLPASAHARRGSDLDAGVHDADLLAALHPTPRPSRASRGHGPGVAPHPRASIVASTPGLVGRVGAFGLDVAVALQRARLDGSSHRLRGAGVVRGSRADAEWDETEQKLGGMRATWAPPDARKRRTSAWKGVGPTA